MYLMKHRSGKVVEGETLSDVARAAGASLSSGRVLCVDGVPYHSYGQAWSDKELDREFGRAATRKLRENHGWTLYRETDWRD